MKLLALKIYLFIKFIFNQKPKKMSVKIKITNTDAEDKGTVMQMADINAANMAVTFLSTQKFDQTTEISILQNDEVVRTLTLTK